MSSLTDRQKQALLEIARRSIIAAVEGREMPQDAPGDLELRNPGGAFVTLHRGARLRGCIGQLPGKDELIDVVARCSALAALEDPRFPAVTKDEIAGLEIEISVLSEPQDTPVEDIVPGKHGLMVSRDCARGVLLPQVAGQMGWSAETFLEETCVKAGLHRSAWKEPETRVQSFTAEIFSESQLSRLARSGARYSIST
ncbi:MAG TPA: AmmeMemoRadiSam system protein A [Candidatus Acidoferrales bacterium]|nr:AmmeMemoRadiSam system protein A [Candidatus Acidoferrales bacterium]